MKLTNIAPRLARARDQINEVERVLGWMRDKSWIGGFYVLVPVTHWLPERGREWIRVERVTADATPYPIKGTIEDPTRRLMRDGDGRITPSDMGNVKVPGQWGFWEVAGIRFISDDFPEIFELNANSTTGPPPHPPVHQPWGVTEPPCSEAKPYPSRGFKKLVEAITTPSMEEINQAIRPGPIRMSVDWGKSDTNPIWLDSDGNLIADDKWPQKP